MIEFKRMISYSTDITTNQRICRLYDPVLELECIHVIDLHDYIRNWDQDALMQSLEDLVLGEYITKIRDTLIRNRQGVNTNE